MSKTASLSDTLAVLAGAVAGLFLNGAIFYYFWKLAIIEWLALDVPPLRYITAVVVVAIFNHVTNHIFGHCVKK